MTPYQVAVTTCLTLAGLAVGWTLASIARSLRTLAERSNLTIHPILSPAARFALQDDRVYPVEAHDLDLDHRRREVLLAAGILRDAMDGGEPGPEADLHDELIGVCETVDRLRAVMPAWQPPELLSAWQVLRDNLIEHERMIEQ